MARFRNLYELSEAIENVGADAGLTEKVDNLEESLADPYDSTESYSVGDLCTNDGVLCECITATSGTFDPDDWSAVTVIDKIDEGIESAVEDLSTYSTTEKEVGTWIDGSTIYERVITYDTAISLTTAGTVIFNRSVYDYSNIISVVCLGDNPSIGYPKTAYYNANDEFLVAMVNQFDCTSIILRYTKTTT